MNLKKCCPPASIMEILGFLYDAITKSCKLSAKKQKKYIAHMNDILQSTHVPRKNLEKVMGNLTYAAWVSHFGRPFLLVLSSSLTKPMKDGVIVVTAAMKNALMIWRMILTRNQGLSFDFILGRLPRGKNEWFIDASTSYG